MWVGMMAAMMVPPFVPFLLHYRAARQSLSGAAVFVGAGYFAVWIAWAVAAWLLGAASWPARLSPVATGLVIALAGCVQLTPWKERQLAACRVATVARSPWRYGLRAGVGCVLCCVGYMVVLLAIGMMHIAAMVGVAAAIAIERAAPRPALVARAGGVVLIGLGALVIVRALVQV
jgi:predicted metal-binding membrane protein